MNSLNRQNLLNLLSVLILFPLVVSCEGNYTPPQEVVPFTISREEISTHNPVLLTIDDTMQVSAEELLLHLEESNLLIEGGLLLPAQVADTLEEIILDSLMNYVIDTFDLHSDTAGWANYTVSRVSRLKAAVMEHSLYKYISIDSSLVDSFYWSRPDLFKRKSRVDVAYIVLSKPGYRGGPDSLVYQRMSDHDLDSLIDFRLRLLKSEIHDSVDFQEAARLYSLDEVKGALGGRLGWVQRYDLHPEVEEVLYDPQTKVNEVIGPLDSRDGSHLFFMYDRHFEGIPPLDSVMFQLAEGYIEDMGLKRLAVMLVDSLRTARPTVFNDSALMLSSAEADRELWVAVADGVDTVRYVTFERAKIPFRSAYQGNFGLMQFQAIAQSVVDERLVVSYAEDTGIDEIPEVKTDIDRIYRLYSRDALRKTRLGLRYIPSSEEISEYFESNPEEFTVERPYKIQQILVQDLELAGFVSTLAESGHDFLELAQEHYVGEPDIRRAAADLGWIGPEDFAPEVYAVLDSLIIGDISQPIESEYGFHVVRILEKKHSLALSEANLPIKTKLADEYRYKERKRWAKILRKNRNLRFHTAGFQGVRLTTRELRLIMRQRRLGVQPGKSFKQL